jgi:hypothetical protein
MAYVGAPGVGPNVIALDCRDERTAEWNRIFASGAPGDNLLFIHEAVRNNNAAAESEDDYVTSSSYLKARAANDLADQELLSKLIQKKLPGCYVRFSADRDSSNSYWDLYIGLVINTPSPEDPDGFDYVNMYGPVADTSITYLPPEFELVDSVIHPEKYGYINRLRQKILEVARVNGCDKPSIPDPNQALKAMTSKGSEHGSRVSTKTSKKSSHVGLDTAPSTSSSKSGDAR